MEKPKKLPKRKPRYANPNHPMNAERTTGHPDGVTRKASGGGVKVKSGDTLSQIAKKNNISLRDLLSANPSIKNANQIKVGQNIKLPSTKMVGSSIGATNNPYKGMSKKSMADMDVKNKSLKRQQAATARNRVSAVDELKAKATANKKMPTRAMTIKEAQKRRSQRQMSSSGLRDDDVAAYKGGAMKKVRAYKSGGSMCRGGGAATKGKRYGKSG